MFSGLSAWEIVRRGVLTLAFAISVGILISSTELTLAEYVRYAVSFAAWFCVLEVIVFVYTYVRKIGPLRQFLESHHALLIAPPYKWTLQYHLVFGWILFWMGVSTQWAIHKGTPLNPFTLLILPGVIWGCVVISRFLKYYLREFESVEVRIRRLEAENAELRSHGITEL